MLDRRVRVVKEGPAEVFGIDPGMTRDGKARLVDRGPGGLCVEYTLSEEALIEVWLKHGPPGTKSWPPRKAGGEPDISQMRRAVLCAFAAWKKRAGVFADCCFTERRTGNCRAKQMKRSPWKPHSPGRCGT